MITTETLRAEYNDLKRKLFDDHSFVVLDENYPAVKKMAKRYDQLFQFFNPTFRTQYWVNPLEEKPMTHAEATEKFAELLLHAFNPQK